MPLPAFFLRQLRRRGLLIALAGLAIVLVIAQVRREFLPQLRVVLLEFAVFISTKKPLRSITTGPHFSHLERREAFCT